MDIRKELTDAITKSDMGRAYFAAVITAKRKRLFKSVDLGKIERGELNPKLDTFEAIVDAIGYRLTLVPKDDVDAGGGSDKD
jgi:DNA-binding phage protein